MAGVYRKNIQTGCVPWICVRIPGVSRGEGSVVLREGLVEKSRISGVLTDSFKTLDSVILCSLTFPLRGLRVRYQSSDP